jgi:hypothetical protein
MESFAQILTAGGHTNSLGRAHEVLEAVQQHPHKIDQLFGCIFADDPWVRMRAIDAFEKIVRDNPEAAQPYVDILINDLTQSSQPSIQWHLAQLFAEVTLDQSQTTKVLAWLQAKIATTDVDWIVAVNVMKTLLYFRGMRLVNDKTLKQLFAVQSEHSSKSVRQKAELFLESLER